MQPSTIVIRHRQENLKKCSLRGLESRKDFLFLTYPNPKLLDKLPAFETLVILQVGAPVLSVDDRDKTLLVLDGTWRYAEKMLKVINPPADKAIYRSLPPFCRTAYPRRQQDCQDPECGLASIEAIYLAYQLMQRPVDGLLDYYYWKEDFLRKNQTI